MTGKPSSLERTAELLNDALGAIAIAREHMEGISKAEFIGVRKNRDAVERQLMIVG